MTYTPNVPQGSQQIATTQPIIQANFGFIEDDLQVDHVFNGNNPPQPEGTHLQAQMANRSDPSSLPSGIAGMYYIGDYYPKYYNTVIGAQAIQVTPTPFKVLTGTVVLSTSAATVSTIPAKSVGYYFIFYPAVNNFVNTASAAGFVMTDQNSLFAARTAEFDPGIFITASGLDLQAGVNSGGNSGTYTYFIIYYTP